MLGALSVVGSSVMDSHTCPCLCVDALPTTTLNFKSVGKHAVKPAGSLDLSSSFIDSGHDRRLSVTKALPGIVSRSSRKQKKNRRLRIVNELGGQYEDSFEDVKLVRKSFLKYDFK